MKVGNTVRNTRNGSALKENMYIQNIQIKNEQQPKKNTKEKQVNNFDCELKGEHNNKCEVQ